MPSNPALIRRALEIKHVLDAKVARYDEVCESYAKQGYRPHYCFHGTDLWVDYDPICGWCEDDGPRWWETAKWALIEARAEFRKSFQVETGAS